LQDEGGIGTELSGHVLDVLDTRVKDDGELNEELYGEFGDRVVAGLMAQLRERLLESV
jgi:hypothetical protein